MTHPSCFNLRVGIPIMMVGLASIGCQTAAREDARVEPVYDRVTGKLQLLKYDANSDGTVDTWSYMDGAKVVRIELDPDQNHIIDRWEYYRPDQTIERIGTSRNNDGTVDSWTFYDEAGAVTKLELSTSRNGTVDRIEYYERGTRVRAEQDTNADGRVDKWEVYEGSRLSSVDLDVSQRGRPDRRLTYGADGNVSLELLP